MMRFLGRSWLPTAGIARALAVVVMCAAHVAADAQNLLITDYRVPVSTARSLRLNLDYDYKRLGGDAIENRGNLFANYKYFYDSLPFAYSVELNAAANRSETVAFASVLADESARAFVWDDLFVGAELRRQYETSEDGSERIDAVAVLGAGFGRFINATPLAKAVRMEEWLLESGLLVDDLPGHTLIELAQVIQREGEFRDRHGETYRQNWYAAMEAAIRESGMLKPAKLDAMALLRMDEVLGRERTFDRFFGRELSVGASRQVFRSDIVPEALSGVEMTGRLAKPFGWRTQWNARLTLSSPTDDDFGRAYGLLAQNDLSYELGDRIDLLLSHVLRADRAASADALGYDTVASHRLTGSFVFFVENALTFSVNASLIEGGGESQRALAATFGYRLF
ncbi:hypothetical protein CMK11_04930 [Candidatus Poribacteria bacterium]|nr:hypothetical protein [Candidatus Poribacteria bacterium]